MFEKIGQCLVLTELKIKNCMRRFAHEEKGGTEIVAILLIIIILIGIAVVFRNQLETLIIKLFGRMSSDVDAKIQ